jgi:2-methylfumaryl-CoA hydratase
MKQGNFLEDFSPKKVFQHPIPRTINEGDVALYMGLTGARNPLHCASDFSLNLGYKKIPIDDILLFHIAFGRSVNHISLNAVANLGYANIQFKHNAYVGDTLRTESEVIGIKENSNKTTGIVYVHSKTFNQHHEEILSWIRWVMIPKKDKNAKIQELIPDNIPKEALIDGISRKNIDFGKVSTIDTGSEKLFDDYKIGEVINHSAGITIDETDHTLATKLYQNNAKLHFDAFMMKDTPFKRRLIYGGHIISICRAISYEGLENAVQIIGINSGIHSNPSFAEDTIYCRSEILNKFDHKNFKNAGILRIRQIGIKNKKSFDLKNITTEKEGKKLYDPSVVLDLDYFVVIPKRN